MREKSKVISSKKETDDFFAAFDHQAEEEPEDTDSIELIIELWEDNKDLFEIYRIAQSYLTEWGGLPTQLISDLINGRKLPFEESLIYLPSIHYGYSKITAPPADKANDRENS